MSDQTPARSFGSVADAYDRARPPYPREAAAWLAGDRPTTVLELGAGTGKLTEVLVGLGHDVHATDPDEAMLARLRQRLPDVRTSVAGAEEIPAADAAYDVVVAAQAFHWFDHERALPEIARVLKPGGRLAVVWNRRDERIPWVRRLGGIIGSQDQQESEEPLVTSPLFGFVESQEFRFWQVVDRVSIQDLVLSRSNVAVLDEAGRAAKLAEVLAFYDDYGRGMDGMQMPYIATCFRARVVDRPKPAPPDPGPGRGPDGPDDQDGAGDGADRSDDPGRVTDDGSDPDVLLIDFR
jgi:ubiquinone/menaquinone biosynthesis C-methylase UbiE